MPIPAMPGADLVIGQADLLLGDLEALLDGPASAGDPREGGERGRDRAEGDVEGEVLRVLAAAPDQHPAPPGRLSWMGGRQASPVVEPLPLAAGPGREAPPGAGRQGGGDVGDGVPAGAVVQLRRDCQKFRVWGRTMPLKE